MKSLRKIIVLVLFFVGMSAWADAPGIINYQGKLTDQNGNPITDNAGITIVFSLYNVPTGGSYLFQETRTVPIDNGVFVVQIGSETVPGGVPRTVFQNNAEVYLGVKVGADLEMTPRERLVSSPYALAVASGSVGQREIIASTITLSQIDTSSFDTRYSTVGHTHSGIDPGAHQSTHVDGGSDRLTGSLTLTTATLTGASFSVGESTLVVKGGNVGIGTTSPGISMHIYRNSISDVPRLLVENAAASSESSIDLKAQDQLWRFYNSADDGSLRFYDGLFDQIILKEGSFTISPPSFFYSSMTLTGLSVSGTNPVFTVMRSSFVIRADGRVGVGTTTPSYLMHMSTAAGLNNTFFAVSTGPVDLFKVSGTSVALKVPLYFPDGTAQTSAYTGGTAAHQSTHVDGGSDRLTGSLTLTTATLAGSSFSVGGSTLTVGLGKVGIGTTQPAVDMEITGVIRAEGIHFPLDVNAARGLGFNWSYYNGENRYVSDGPAFELWQSHADDYMTIVAAPSGTAGNLIATEYETISIRADGKVGLGTTQPAYNLHLSSTAGTTSTIFAVSTGPVDLFRVSGTSAALKVPLYFPDGTAQTTAGAVGSNYVAKAGDTMSGQLTVQSSVTFTNNAFSVGGSTFVVRTGQAGVRGVNPEAVFTVTSTNTSTAASTVVGADFPMMINAPSNQSTNAKSVGVRSMVHANTGSDVYNVYGIETLAEESVSGASNQLVGIVAGGYGGANGANNSIIGGSFWSEQDGGSATMLQGINVWSGTYGGTVSTNVAVNVSMDKGAGTITNRYGVLIAPFSGTATDDFGLFQQGPLQKNAFMGKIGIGMTTPNYFLHVATSAGTTGTLMAVSTGAVDIFRVLGTSVNLKVPLVFPDGTVQTTAGGAASQWTTNVSSIGYTGVGGVGIGMTNPAAKLDVSGNIRASGISVPLFGSVGFNWGEGDLYMGNAAAYEFFQDNASVQLWSAPAGTSGSDISTQILALSVTPQGKVGVGTTSPTYQMQVATAAGTTNTLFAVSTGTVDLFKVSGTSAALKVPLYFRDGTSQNTAAVSSQWTTNGAEIGYTSGNIGIGTTDPNNELDIMGGDTYVTVQIRGDSDAEKGISLINSSSGRQWDILMFPNAEGLDHFGIEHYDGVWKEHLSISPQGKVGIGVTTPNYGLQVSSAAGTTGTIFAVSTGPVDLFKVSGTSAALKVPLYFADGTVQTTAGGAASQWTTNGTNIGYTGGYVGIGATNPSSDLHVVGDAVFTASAAISGTGLSAAAPAFQVVGGTFTILRNGRVGIGTTTPDFRLEVVGSSDEEALFVQNYNVASNPVMSLFGPTSTSITTGKALAINTQGESFSRFMAYTDGKIGFGSGSATRDVYLSRLAAGTMLISNDAANGMGSLAVTDKVGVGTTSPSYRMQVSTAAGTTGTIFSVSTGAVDLFRVLGTSVNVKVPIVFPDGSAQSTAYGSAMVVKGNSGTSMTIDWSAGNTQHVTLTGACAFTLSGGVSGMKYTLVLKQNGTGGYVPTWGSEVRWPSGTAPTVTGTANKTTYIGFIYNSVDSKYDGIAVSNDF